MPAVPPDVVRCRLVFDLGSGAVADQAVMGFHMRRNHGIGDPTEWQADVDEIATKIRDKWVSNVSAPSQWSTDVVLNRAETYHLDASTGLTLHKGTAVASGASAWHGSSNNPSLPFEVACAVSLYAYTPGSFTPNARSKRGRFYLPPFQTSMMGTGDQAGQYNASDLNTLSGKIAAFLNDVEGLTVGPQVGGAGDFMHLVLLSRAQTDTYQVTTCRVGHVPDSQRRRRNAAPEAYIDTPITVEG